MTSKILNEKIIEEIYYYHKYWGLFPEEQKGCCKKIRGTYKLLYADQHRPKKENVAMEWINYKQV